MIQIQFVETSGEKRQLAKKLFLLRDEDNGDWIGPEINLSPISELKLIQRVEVKVSGTPDVVAKRLQAGYGGRTFDEPFPLSKPMTPCGSGRIQNANPLPALVNCELRVIVRYFDTDAKGRRVGEPREIAESIVLHSGSKPDQLPVLTVVNKELQVLVGTPTSQTLTIRNRREKADAPTLKLIYPDTLVAPDDPCLPIISQLLPELQTKMNGVLKGSPSCDESDPTVTEYRFGIQFDLSQPTKNKLSEVEEGVRFPIVASYADAKPSRWTIVLEAESVVNNGWVVIDFGTTNSTVTLYDSVTSMSNEGLPLEQENLLRHNLISWLKGESAVALGARYRALDSDWNRLRSQTLQMLQVKGIDALDGWLKGDNGPRLHELIAQLEIHLQSATPALKRVAYVKLQDIYHEALRVPPLQRNQLFPMRIEPDLDQETISSELEILSIQSRPQDQEDRRPQVQMGIRAQKNRLKAISEAKQSIAEIESRFHPSPKRYFGSDKQLPPVEIDGGVEPITVDQLMRAGWERLKDYAEEARKKSPIKFSPGRIRRAVITYPTIAPPSVRKNIQRLMGDLGIADVRTDYDEAIASAIFYIMREYNSASEMGLEGFKARARAVKGRDSVSEWQQNLLVFDIGGGTTDVALIRLTLQDLTLQEETVPFAKDVRHAGGRYYRLTPEVLSSTGHMELGGELMTLRIFRLLKGMIADRLLTLVQDVKWACEPVKMILDAELPAEARSQSRYKSGWIVETIRAEHPEPITGRLEAALKLAERVFSTTWENVIENRGVRLQAFYTLWELAEEAKKQLGSKQLDAEESKTIMPFLLTADKFKEMVGLCYDLEKFAFKNLKTELELRLPVDHMEEMIARVVDEAVNVAAGALERLPANDKVDWLILSGQSCNLRMVDRKIRDKFQRENKFIWNPERVTFLPQYAKLSTSLGACYAESLRRKRFSPEGSQKDLKRGINTLYFNVKNLFSRLPCSFVLELGGGTKSEPVLRAGTELKDIYGIDMEDKQRGIARSDWQKSAVRVEVKRDDFKNGKQPIWGVNDETDTINDLKMPENKFIDEVHMQFEVDHRLNVEVLFYRQDEKTPLPHYRLKGNEEKKQLPECIQRLAEQITEARQEKAKKESGNAKAAAQRPVEPVKLPPLFDANRTLQWLISVGSSTAPSTSIFKQGQLLNAVCHSGEGNSVFHIALSEECATDFQVDGTLTIWAKHPSLKEDVKLGEIRRPGEKPVFVRHYRFTLDENGNLRAHPGEPAYWESEDPHCLAEQRGRVFRRPLTAAKRETDADRNPFNGKH